MTTAEGRCETCGESDDGVSGYCYDCADYLSGDPMTTPAEGDR